MILEAQNCPSAESFEMLVTLTGSGPRALRLKAFPNQSRPVEHWRPFVGFGNRNEGFEVQVSCVISRPARRAFKVIADKVRTKLSLLF